MNFELQHFHEYHELFQQNTVFPSVSSNFLEFRMFWHVPFQELQVSKRNRHFEQNFQHLFPVPFFASLWVSLADCASASLKAVSLAPRMRPSLGCLAASPWSNKTSNIQNKKNIPTVKSNYFRVACQSNVFSFYSGNLGIPSRVLGDLFQISSLLFPRVRWSLEPRFQIDKSPGTGWFNPKNGLFNGESYGYLSSLFLSHPHVWWAHHTTKLLHGLDPHLIWWIPSFDGRKPEAWQQHPVSCWLYHFRVHYVPIWWFYCCYLLIV